MKNYKERLIDRKETYLDTLTCDLCAKVSENEENWSDESYESIEVLVKITERTTYPSDNDESELAVDLCPDCFENRLLPWLKSQGCNIPKRMNYEEIYGYLF